jgi:transposase
MNEVGIDVSARSFVAEINRRGRIEKGEFDNQPSGYRKLIGWATRRGQSARVCLESTGVYGLGLALALHRAARVEVMVANPKAVRHFAEALQVRAKTDGVDAGVVRAYLSAMPFVAWQPPSEEILQLQGLSRRIGQLKKEQTREKNRLHAVHQEGSELKLVAHDIAIHIRHLERRIEQLSTHARQLIERTAALHIPFELIDSIPGFAETATVQVLGELAPLPQDLSAAQWVAHSGLDPRPYESGTSVHRPRRISKHGNARIRAGLYMPALVAIQNDPNVKAFYEKQLAAGQAPLQAITAVMRKLLHAIWGMLHHQQPWDGNKFYIIPNEA